MGFRFRKSIKVAPGVKINLGKKGASVTVGNKYARTTIGNGKKTNSISIPGTGISYVEQTSTNKKKNKIESNHTTLGAVSNGNGNQGPNQQMSWETAFKILKWSFYALLAFIIFMMFTDSTAVLIGAAVIVTGMIMTKKKKQGKINFKPTWLITTFGWLLTLVLWVSNIDPEEVNTVTPEPSNEINTLVSTPVEQKYEDDKEERVEVDTELATAAAESVESETTVVEEPVESETTVVEEPVESETTVVEEPVEDVVVEEVEEPVSEPVVKKEYFSNCKEMNAVYPSGVPSDHPAYDSARDRDKDGWACER